MKKWLALAFVALIAIATYVGAGPYLTVRAIRGAVKDQDAAALSKQVDFPTLRASLKAQLSDQLLRKAGLQSQANPFAALGMSLANVVISGGVDSMVNPIGLRALMQGRQALKGIHDDMAPADPAVPAPEPLHGAHYRYESPSRFTATIADDRGRPLVFVLTRDGLHWKLSDIRLPR